MRNVFLGFLLTAFKRERMITIDYRASTTDAMIQRICKGIKSDNFCYNKDGVVITLGEAIERKKMLFQYS